MDSTRYPPWKYVSSAKIVCNASDIPINADISDEKQEMTFYLSPVYFF
jgi:hypothetical protein